MRTHDRAYTLMSLPAIILIAILTIVPIALLVVFSFTAWNLIVPNSFRFYGFQNYIRAFTDARALNSIKVSLYYVFVNTAIQVILGFVIAYLLFLGKRWTRFLRSILLLPMLLPPVVVGLSWKMLLTPNLGGINYFLELVGINAPAWLGQTNTALIAVTIAAVWEWTPFVMIVLLAGLESMPGDPMEAALIDGANTMQRIRYIVLPALRQVFLIVIILRIVESLGILPVIYVMTAGGPANATEPINLYAFTSGIDFLDVSFASSLLVLYIFILLASASFFIIDTMRTKRM